MIITKSPVTKLSPWMYAVPSPSLPARGFKTWASSTFVHPRHTFVILTILSSPYALASCLAISCVPSGLASSTTIISQVRLLFPTSVNYSTETARHALFIKRPCEKPYDYRQVFAFVICWKDDGVLVSVRAVELALHVQRY